MAEQERRRLLFAGGGSINHPFEVNPDMGGAIDDDRLALLHDDVEEAGGEGFVRMGRGSGLVPSSLTTSPSTNKTSSRSSSSSSSSSNWAWNIEDDERAMQRRRRYQRWLFFGAGVLFLSAFFTLLLLLFFDVVHVGDDSAHRPNPASPRGRFFQLSDVHLDLLYRPNLNQSTFCRENPTAQEMKFASRSKPGDGSGGSVNFAYGRYGCDSPVELVQSALDYMVVVDWQPDFILITGDIPAHSLRSAELHNQSLTQFTAMIRKNFPQTLVLPLLGNNDVYPDYSMPYGPSAWLEYLGQLWSPWLGEEQRATFTRGGYYSIRIPAAKNLRIIALNTVIYSTEFVPSNDTNPPVYQACTADSPADPNGQFSWLQAELTLAQRRQEKVIIAGHIPYGVNEYDGSINWCPFYAQTFLKIIYSFADDVIINQIFAHYHLDEFRILLAPKPEEPDTDGEESGSEDSRKAVSNIMIHPSISPQHFNNPSFRYYHYFRETGAIADYAHYYLDLPMANIRSNPWWTLEYTFQNAYSMNAVNTTTFEMLWTSITNSFSSNFARYVSYKSALYIANAFPNMCAISSADHEAYQQCLAEYNVLSPSSPSHREL